MNEPSQNKQNPQDSSKIDEWAHEKVKDVIFGCVLNIKLHRTGMCSKLLCEMTHEDLREYALLIDGLHSR